MAGLDKAFYSFDEDGILRLQKDLNYMLYNLDDNNVRRLHTEYCQIKSEDGETVIDGPQLIMKAADSTTIRLRMGWNPTSSEFEFNLYGINGNPTIELDSTGNIVNRGSINTAEDIYVGNRLFVGWGGSTLLPTATLSTRGIYLMQPNSTQYMAAIYSTNVSATTDPEYVFEIRSSNPARISAPKRVEINIDDAFSGATGEGVYLGAAYGDVFIGTADVWYNKVMSPRQTKIEEAGNIRYCRTHNSKFIARPTTEWTAVGGSVTAQATTRVWTSTRAVYISPDTTSPYSPGLQSTIASIDLTKFDDNTNLTSDDWLVMAVWFNNTTSYTNHVELHIGADSANRYYYQFSSGYTTGWNLMQKKLGDFTLSTGSPAFNNIAWVRTGFSVNDRPANQGSGYVDYIGVIRADPDDADDFKTFQRDVNSTNLVLQDNDSFLFDMNNRLYYTRINSAGLSYTNYLVDLRHDFDMTVDARVMRENEMPSISAEALADFNDIARVTLSSGVLRLFGQKEGTTFGYSINCESFTPFQDAQIGLKKWGNNWRGWFRLTDDPGSYRELTEYNGPDSTSKNYTLYVGDSVADAPTAIENIKVEPLYESIS